MIKMVRLFYNLGLIRDHTVKLFKWMDFEPDGCMYTFIIYAFVDSKIQKIRMELHLSVNYYIFIVSKIVFNAIERLVCFSLNA
jgi:hypothetical protein